MTTHPQHYQIQHADMAALIIQIEAAALNARNLLRVANRELMEDIELGLSLVAAAERYIADVVVINEQMCASNRQAITSDVEGESAA